MLSSASVLYYDRGKPVELCCDASRYGIGAVLAHRTDSGEEMAYRFCIYRRLTAAEKRYSHLDKEALTIMFRVAKFNQFVWGLYFDIFANHKPWLGLLGHARGIPQRCSTRVRRWA